MTITRQQINVLPNFSMTDYASQGKSRSFNPVNLSHCKNFHSIYTCLSRSSSAAGTLIIRGFNPAKFTKGLPGYLRQEFRELNLLNHITKEIYEGILDKKYFGDLRNPMLYKYQTDVKRYDLYDLHPALKSSYGELIIKDQGDDGTWTLSVYTNLMNLDRNKHKGKRTLSDLHSAEKGADCQKSPKKIRINSALSNGSNGQSPLGLIWDANDYSCAYDTVFTMLYHIWNISQFKHKAYFADGTPLLRILHPCFISLLNGTCTFESIRDRVRSILNHEKPQQYRYGANYTDIDELVRDLTSSKSYAISRLRCLQCRFSFVDRTFTYLRDYTAVGWSSEIAWYCIRMQLYRNI